MGWDVCETRKFPNLVTYGATNLVDSNLPLTSKLKFRIGLANPDLARPKRNFCFDVNGRFEST